MDDEKLLHPNLLQNCELIMLIREVSFTLWFLAKHSRFALIF